MAGITFFVQKSLGISFFSKSWNIQFTCFRIILGLYPEFLRLIKGKRFIFFGQKIIKNYHSSTYVSYKLAQSVNVRWCGLDQKPTIRCFFFVPPFNLNCVTPSCRTIKLDKSLTYSPSQSAPTFLVLKTRVGLWPWKKSGTLLFEQSRVQKTKVIVFQKEKRQPGLISFRITMTLFFAPWFLQKAGSPIF